jgi:hypothetical protein
MLTYSNTKLGLGIWAFSLPAVLTCPGKTKACLKICYARRGYFCMPSVQAFLAANHQASLGEDFAGRVRAEIRANLVKLLRVHVSGDYYDLPYVRKWLEVVRACRATRFFSYTRSWRVAALRPALAELAAEPNVSLWWSVDRHVLLPPEGLGGAGLAYMSSGDGDLPLYPVGVVFRDRDKRPMKFTPGGDFVCPHEQGVKREHKITCARCLYCVQPRQLRRPAQLPSAGGRVALALVG